MPRSGRVCHQGRKGRYEQLAKNYVLWKKWVNDQELQALIQKIHQRGQPEAPEDLTLEAMGHGQQLLLSKFKLTRADLVNLAHMARNIQRTRSLG